MSCINNWNGRIFVKPEAPVQVLIDVDGEAPIKVREEQRGDVKAYVVSYAPYAPPTVSLTTIPSTLEIGQTAEVTYKGSCLAGSDGIKSKVADPVATITDGDNNTFSFKATVTASSIGKAGKHTVTVTDNLNKTWSTFAEVDVKHRYLIGSVARGTTTFAAKDSGKLGSYEGFHTYTIPEGEHHIAWLVPAGEGNVFPTVCGHNGIVWPTKVLGTVVRKNAYLLDVTYDLVVTTNYYYGLNSIDLTL